MKMLVTNLWERDRIFTSTELSDMALQFFGQEMN